MKKLAVLLATYNSQKFLEAQIDSLLNQTYKDFVLYIRDDGSIDNTMEIIRNYLKRYSNIILMEDSVHCRKSMGSFVWLLENVEADYYMFCDHDDIWLPDKIRISLDRISKIERDNRPAIVCSDLKVVDENLNIISESFWEYMKLRPELLIQKNYALSCNLFTGCTMLINKMAKEVSLPLGRYARMHDSWIGLRVIANDGIIDYINAPLILYRQHDRNVCGAKEVSCRWNYYSYKLRMLKSVIKSYKANYLMANEAFNGQIKLAYFLFFRFIYLFRR